VRVTTDVDAVRAPTLTLIAGAVSVGFVVGSASANVIDAVLSVRRARDATFTLTASVAVAVVCAYAALDDKSTTAAVESPTFQRFFPMITSLHLDTFRPVRKWVMSSHSILRSTLKDFK
jgi:hypothetical protein